MEVLGMDFSYHMWNLEKYLIHFYNAMIIDDLRWIDLQSNDNCMRKIRDAYSNYVLKNRFLNISFDTPGMRCAYIFSNTPNFASCMAYHFSKFLHANDWFLSGILTEKSFNLCCLGGGPGTEVVAVTKVLELISIVFHFPRPIIIQATIIDTDPGWGVTLRKITQNWWRRIDSRVVELRISFEQADLTQPLSQTVQDIVRNSNFVTMAHFVSAVYGTEGRAKISDILKGVIQNMSVNGVFFFLNSSRSRYTNLAVIGNVVVSSANMYLVYGPFYHESYHTTDNGRYLCYNLYSPFYGTNWQPLFSSQNHIAAWRKRAI